MGWEDLTCLFSSGDHSPSGVCSLYRLEKEKKSLPLEPSEGTAC